VYGYFIQEMTEKNIPPVISRQLASLLRSNSFEVSEEWAQSAIVAGGSEIKKCTAQHMIAQMPSTR
jgi:hypothetical protein